MYGTAMAVAAAASSSCCFRLIASAAAAPPLLLILLLALQLLLLSLLRALPTFTTSSPSSSYSLSFLFSPPAPSSSPSISCDGSLIYVYDLPPRFNSHLLRNCSSLSPWNVSLCPALSDDGMGVAVRNPPWPPSNAWFATDQFTAELLFHRKLQHHPCITHDPNLAALFFVPFYAGLAVYRPLFFPEAVQERDELCNDVMQWLSEQASWRRKGGSDHFFVVGRITWDFRRDKPSGWGSSFFYMPLMENTTRLVIEKDPGDARDIGIPYPTSFHPSNEQDLRQWQEYVTSRNRNRTLLFSYAGGARKKFKNDFRQILLEQCELSGSCKTLNCIHESCRYPKEVMELFLDSKFCLQPRGDSFTRRSTFDCLLAGAIPVFFWSKSAYLQYQTYLPSDPSSYSVFIPKDEVKNDSSRGRIKQVLMGISEQNLSAMQATVVNLIPSIVYGQPNSSVTTISDAFDLAIRAVLHRVRSRSSHPAS